MKTRDNGRTRATPEPSRRNLLAGASAALVAGAAIACQAKGATPGADVELIAVCNRVTVLSGEIEALYGIRHDIESERRTQAQMDALYDDRDAALCRIDQLPAPVTLAGAQAAAAAARSLLLRSLKGDLEHDNDAEWLAFVALEYLGGENAA